MSQVYRRVQLVLFVLGSLWVALFIWVQKPVAALTSLGLIFLWLLMVVAIFVLAERQPTYRRRLRVFYGGCLLVALVVFFSLTPRNDRLWQAESSRIAGYRFVDGQIEITNVRNFTWRTVDDYDPHWETRRYSLEDLHSTDLIVSHFLAGPIAHVFVSFGFKNGDKLAFSAEVRQEQHEGFSMVGGFFRQYELALIIGDERDLIYKRTNIRQEDLYLYPLAMQQIDMQMLFLEYMNKVHRLAHHPRWYNTLISNCSTIIFDLSEYAVGVIPRDYRVLLPGLLPNYLYDYHQLSHQYSLGEWRKRAHVNPKTAHLAAGEVGAGREFSRLIRSE